MPPKRLPPHELASRLAEVRGKKIYENALATVPGIRLLGFEAARLKYGQVDREFLDMHSPRSDAEVAAWIRDLLTRNKIYGEYLFKFRFRETGNFYLWARGILSPDYEWLVPIWTITNKKSMKFLSLDANNYLQIHPDEYEYVAIGYPEQR